MFVPMTGLQSKTGEMCEKAYLWQEGTRRTVKEEVEKENQQQEHSQAWL
jgi:hypothetical protein